MEHGFAKLARGLDAFPAILQALGVPAPHLMGWLTNLVEIFGGLAVLLGALVPLASIPMAAVLLVATITVHLPYGFSSIKLQAVTAAGAQFGPPGYETDLLYLACLAALVLGGSGPLAIDGLLAKRREVARPQKRFRSKSNAVQRRFLTVALRTEALGVYAMSFLNLFISAGKAFSAWRRREQAYAGLMALDDRSLADIGIHRLQICALAECARKRTEFPMNNFTPDDQNVLAARQDTSAEFVLKNPDAALATMRRPASLLSPARRS